VAATRSTSKQRPQAPDRAASAASPLLNTIRVDLHLSRPVAGLLTTVPKICIGVGAFLVPHLGARGGRERTLTGAIAFIGAATLARLGAANAVSLRPVLAGGLRDLTGAYATPFAAYAGVCVLLVVLASRFTPQPVPLPPVP
jgi:cyanate permease